MIMKKILVKIIHFFNDTYFEELTYHALAKWGIDDVIDGEIIFTINDYEIQI